MNEQLSPAASRAAWLQDTPKSRLVRFDAAALAKCKVDSAGVAFLTEAGLPGWASPHMHFFFDGGETLPKPVDDLDREVAGVPDGAGMIGNTGEDWPIWFAPQQPGLLFCRTLEASPRTLVLNTSVARLAAFLLEVAHTVDAALAWGDSCGVPSAWLRTVYPANLDAQLAERFASIDPSAMQADGYWHRFLQELASRRASH